MGMLIRKARMFAATEATFEAVKMLTGNASAKKEERETTYEDRITAYWVGGILRIDIKWKRGP